MTSPPATSEEIWNSTREHARLWSDAAHRVGLSPQEYQDFRSALLDGKAVYVRLPHHLDAMAGDRHGYIYAVHNAYLPQTVMGWRVKLADGAEVYVPQTCGNLSLRRVTPVVATRPHLVAAKKIAFQPSVAVTTPPVAETPVIVTPPEAAPVAAAPVVVPPASTNYGWLWGLPLVGGLITLITHTNSTPPPIPPCKNGSNQLNVCQGTTSH
jgi:hypothetical protein